MDPEKPKCAQRKGIKVSRLTPMDSAQSGSIGHRMHTSARNKRSVLKDLYSDEMFSHGISIAYVPAVAHHSRRLALVAAPHISALKNSAFRFE